MPCGCITVITDPGPICTNCLIVKDLRFRCDQGPDPCGDNVLVDLAQYNDVTACGVLGATYSLVSFDAVGLTNVSLSAAGVLSADTTNVFSDHEEYEIVYKVNCNDPNSILSATGIVYICMRNPCGYCPTGTVCDPFSATCIPVPPEVIIGNNNNGISIS